MTCCITRKIDPSYHAGESMNSGDSIVDAVVQKFLQRSSLGQAKYGVTLDRTDLQLKDWIQHTQEELMDAILYLEKLKQTPKTS